MTTVAGEDHQCGQAPTRGDTGMPFFGGPMVAGGLGYPLVQVADMAAPVTYPTGSPLLDAHLEGIRPGELWSISGESGSGVTTLAVELAGRFAQGAPVLLCNSHVPTRDLARMLRWLIVDYPTPASRVRLASWQHSWHEVDDRSLRFDTHDARVVILDTWDEQLFGHPRRFDHAELVGSLRRMRHLAEQAGVALVLTSRTPRARLAAERILLDDALDDASTVRMQIGGGQQEGDPYPTLTVRRRGRGGPKRFTLVTTGGRARVRNLE